MGCPADSGGMETTKRYALIVIGALWAATLWTAPRLYAVTLWTLMTTWSFTKWAGRVSLWVFFWPLGLWRSYVHHKRTA